MPVYPHTRRFGWRMASDRVWHPACVWLTLTPCFLDILFHRLPTLWLGHSYNCKNCKTWFPFSYDFSLSANCFKYLSKIVCWQWIQSCTCTQVCLELYNCYTIILDSLWITLLRNPIKDEVSWCQLWSQHPIAAITPTNCWVYFNGCM